MAQTVSPEIKSPTGRLSAVSPGYSAETKEQYVRTMFAEIAPRYDILNRILSFSRDRAWRRTAVRIAAPDRGDRCLDVCSGTGDFAIDLARAVGSGGHVVASDFCEPMIRYGLAKCRRARGGQIASMVANAECLPYDSDRFDVVAVGFGVRNVARLEVAVRELARVTRPGGRVVILEFTRPKSGLMRFFVDCYLFHLLPVIGGLLSKREAYTYLPESMTRFATRQELQVLMETAGLNQITIKDLNLGTVCIHCGVKSSQPSQKGAI